MGFGECYLWTSCVTLNRASTFCTPEFWLRRRPHLRAAKGLYGAGTKLEIPQIPGQDGVWRVLPVDVLRHVEQSLDVLHSRILDEAPAAPPGSEGAFWRGHLPTWTDLDADADIRRDIHDVLIGEVRGGLVESRNYTIELYHTPG